MTLPIVQQLRFARSEFMRSLSGVTDEESRHRFGPINSISWMVGHLADQEQRYWFQRRGVPILVSGLNDQVGFGKPASTPPLGEMVDAWQTVTEASDDYLDSLTVPDLLDHFVMDGVQLEESVGTLLQRVIWHYWFHNGEMQAVRQLLGHTNLPQFVGDINAAAPYTPEAD
jgi:uncharacterized damage-inducible protein DinB